MEHFSEDQLLQHYKDELSQRRETPSSGLMSAHHNILQNNEFYPSDISQENIVRNFSQLKSEFKVALDKLEHRFLSQNKKFAAVELRYEEEKRAIEDLYKIRITADSLARLMAVYKQKQHEYDVLLHKSRDVSESFSVERETWERETRLFESRIEELKNVERSLKSRVDRLSDDLDRERKKRHAEVESELNEKRSELDREFSKKELDLSVDKTEMEELRQKVQHFNEERSKLIESTRQIVSKQMITKYDHLLEMNRQNFDSEIQLYQQRTQTLEKSLAQKNDDIQKTEERNFKLEEKLQQAERQIQQLTSQMMDHSTQKIKQSSVNSAQDAFRFDATKGQRSNPKVVRAGTFS